MFLNCILLVIFYLFSCALSVKSYPVGTTYKACETNGFENLLIFTKIDNNNTWRAVLNLQIFTVVVNNVNIVFIPYGSAVFISGYNHFNFANQPESFYFYPKQGHIAYSFDIRIGSNLAVPLVSEVIVNNCKVCLTKKRVDQNGSEFYTVPYISSPSGNLENNEQTLVTSSPPPETTQGYCGLRKRNHLNLVFDGNIAEPGQWPWHVAIFIKNKNDFKYRCGGSILNKQSVVTAAHCVSKRNNVYDAKKFMVFAGITNLYERNCSECQQFTVVKVVRHPFYRKENCEADIAVLKTEKLIEWTDFVQPICLPSANIPKSNMVEKYGKVVGFGRTESKELSDELRYTEVQVQSDTTCLTSDIFFNLMLHEFTFCAGNGPNSGTAPSTGDSGGGLALPTKIDSGETYWTLRGIVSIAKAGLYASDVSAYVIYTDVAAFSSWIMEILKRFLTDNN